MSAIEKQRRRNNHFENGVCSVAFLSLQLSTESNIKMKIVIAFGYCNAYVINVYINVLWIKKNESQTKK